MNHTPGRCLPAPPADPSGSRHRPRSPEPSCSPAPSSRRRDGAHRCGGERSGRGLEVVGLTVEHLVEPVGVGTPLPRFSWQGPVRRPRPGAGGLRAGGLAGSRRVRGRPGLADGAGGGLRAGPRRVRRRRADLQRAYQWRVRIWDTDDRASAWSEPASFATGLLDPADWEASWIAPATAAAGGFVPARRGHAAGRAPERAVLYVAGRGSTSAGRDSHGICCEQDFGLARGIYEPFVNGGRVGDAELESQPVDSRKRTYYRAWDVTASSTAGENVVGLSIGEDLRPGRPARRRQPRRQHRGAGHRRRLDQPAQPDPPGGALQRRDRPTHARSATAGRPRVTRAPAGARCGSWTPTSVPSMPRRTSRCGW